MSERDATALQPECNGVAPHVTRDETRNTFDEDRLTFGEAGSSSEAKRWHSTVRSRELVQQRDAGRCPARSFEVVGPVIRLVRPSGTVRNSVCEAIMMEGKGASYGYRERPAGPTFSWA